VIKTLDLIACEVTTLESGNQKIDLVTFLVTYIVKLWPINVNILKTMDPNVGHTH